MPTLCRNAFAFKLNMVFSIIGREGILFLDTKNYKVDSDFFGVFVKKGKIWVTYNLGNEDPKKLPTLISKHRVDDTKVHELIITRSLFHHFGLFIASFY